METLDGLRLTVPLSDTDNRAVVGSRLARKLIACLSVLGVLGLAVLPSEHVHSRSDHGRRSEVVHRHFEPHHPVGAGATVDHPDDENAQYLSSAFTMAKPAPRLYPADQFVVVAFSTLQPPPVRWRSLPALFVSVHDPPWTTPHNLRGPPPFQLV